VALTGIVGFLVTVAVAGLEALKTLAPFLAGTALIVAAFVVIRALLKWRHRRCVQTYLDAAEALVAMGSPTDADGAAVAELRTSAGQLPDASRTQIEEFYRGAIADVIADWHVTVDEHRRLRLLQAAFALPPATADQAALEGFLQGYFAVVADRQLTESEEHALHGLRETLGIPPTSVQDHLRFAEQLSAARRVASGTLAQINPDIKLRKGEVCYYTCSVTEQKSTIARTYVVDGVRQKERGFEAVRSGTLYLTDQRLLLVADGSTNLKLDAVLDSAVDAESNMLVVTMDGRRSPYYFEVPEPFVAEAFISRLVGTAGTLSNRQP
jgi:hypothetical protein